MKILQASLVVIILLILAALAWARWRTYKVEHNPNQTAFSHGTADTATLDGEYNGFVTNYKGNWQGKIFLKSNGSGINHFNENGGIGHKYPFKTAVGKGLRDSSLDVIKLDYNQPGNPWWLKYIFDEMVNTTPNTYLGKVHIRLAPGMVFSMGYFTLTKSAP